MHMADALISPAVGGTLWMASASLVALASRKMRQHFDTGLVPLMGVLGAFVFAAQMINFSIPGTGSSGHLGGAMLLSAILGPYAAFLSIASVLVVQALFFADGGLLALGCNIFNLGFFPCFVAYPLIFRPLVGHAPSRQRLMAVSVLASVLGLQLGALSVVVQTTASGMTALPFGTFLWLMLPIHLAIGLVEGMVTAAVVGFVHSTRPELVTLSTPSLSTATTTATTSWSIPKLAFCFALLACLTGGMLSWFASAHPDGLEWSIARTSGSQEMETPTQGIYGVLANMQAITAFMPDYAFKTTEETNNTKNEQSETNAEGAATTEAWPAINTGTSSAGLVGGALTLLLAGLLGLGLRRRCKP